MKLYVAASAALVLFVGCAGSPNNQTVEQQWTPIVDMKDKSELRFDNDLKECRGYGQKVVDEDGTGLARAFAIALFVPRNQHTEASLRTSPQVRQQQTVRRCLAGRGYNILN